MRKFNFVFINVIVMISLSTELQSQTVGTILNTSDSYDGYTLFAPMSNTSTYLIDNCGQVVNEWQSSNRPGLSAYLLEDGSLLRAKNIGNQTFTSGGSGGGVQRFSWDGTLLWDYEVSSTTECQHHDVEYLPNGNVLMVVWESKTQAESIQAGRNSGNAPSSLWPDKIIEVEPNGSSSGTIVWEWHAWDHMIQDEDASKDNFGVVSDHPELIDINYPSNDNSDWLHVNSVNYNPEFDQIVMSVHNTNELWIIDHSTTTQEAASHSGGTYGKGGDLLYRWGNPQAYDRGSVSDKKFYAQHDAKWITEGSDVGKLMVFNNGANRSPGTSYSSVDIIDPPVDAFGNYTLPTNGETFMPSDLYWSYEANPNSDFFSSNISGAHRVANDNTIICEGVNGRLFEVDESGNTVWEYVSPITNSGAVNQGTTPNQNSVFRCTRYAASYAGLSGRDLTPGNVLELNSNFSCELYHTVTGIDRQEYMPIQIIMNPSTNQITLTEINVNTWLSIYDSVGRLMFQKNCSGPSVGVSTSFWPTGIYHVTAITETEQFHKKVLKL
ncbi:MAG: aryl-sulfate sulfotransferase [Flavobacteriales bacterium]|nr:aryl-sulfate sulfotransferase [Flavobacteriales bacterium]